jgi:xylulokinase
MNKDLLLGIDFGTGGCKITIINLFGDVVAESSQEYPTHHPFPGYSEQNPADWFPAMISCIKKTRDEYSLNLRDIKAVSLVASTHNAVLLDEKMGIIRPTIMWTDQRSTSEVEYLEKNHGEDIFRLAYQKVAPTWTLPQLLWIKNNEHDNFCRISKLTFIKDYMRYLLTGSWETDFIDAQGSMLLDVRKSAWSEELCGFIGLDPSVLPPICSPTDITGRLTADAAQLTGLETGTPVVCGTSDSCAEDYAAGAIKPGQCILKLATAGNVNIMTAEANPSPRTLTYSHVIPGLWYSVAATNTAASAMRWFRNNFCYGEMEQSRLSGRNVYQFMEDEAKNITPGSDGLLFHPYLLGERSPYWDPNLRASFIGASMSHTRAHFIRAVMEGVAYSLQDCFRLIEDLNLKVEEFILIGGGSKSDTWAQIVCDNFGKKLTRPKVTDASFGAAIIAGTGAGFFSDLFAAAEKCIKTDRVFIPNEDNHKLYRKYFRVYRAVHDQLEDIYKEIHQITSKS